MHSKENNILQANSDLYTTWRNKMTSKIRNKTKQNGNPNTFQGGFVQWDSWYHHPRSPQDCGVTDMCLRRLVLRLGKALSVPVSPPLHFEGVENCNFLFLDGGYLNSPFLSGRFCEHHGCTTKHVHNYRVRLSEVYAFMYCAPVYAST